MIVTILRIVVIVTILRVQWPEFSCEPDQHPNYGVPMEYAANVWRA